METRVKTLVLSHLVPADDEIWIDLAGTHVKGQIIVGKSMMEI